MKDWVQKNLPVALPILGVALYLCMLIPNVVFYARLGTSPSEIGLGYFQSLGQSAIGLTLTALVILASILVTSLIVGSTWTAARLLKLMAIRVPIGYFLKSRRAELRAPDASGVPYVMRVGLQMYSEVRPYLPGDWPLAEKAEELLGEGLDLEEKDRNPEEEARYHYLVERMGVRVNKIQARSIAILGRLTLVWLKRVGNFIATFVIGLILLTIVVGAYRQAGGIRKGQPSVVKFMAVFGLQGERAFVSPGCNLPPKIIS